MSISEQLRKSVHEAISQGWTENAIAKAVGLNQRVLNRWLAGERENIRGDSMDKLAAWLGSELTERKVPQPGPGVKPQKPRKKPRKKSPPASE